MQSDLDSSLMLAFLLVLNQELYQGSPLLQNFIELQQLLINCSLQTCLRDEQIQV